MKYSDKFEYTHKQVCIIRNNIPNGDINIDGKDDPLHIIRGLLDLYIIDRSIDLQTLLSRPVFEQYTEKNEWEIVKLIEDVQQVTYEVEANKKIEWEDEVEDIFDELSLLQEKSNDDKFYDVRLLCSGGETTYPVQGDIDRITTTVRNMCNGISSHLDERLESILNDVYVEVLLNNIQSGVNQTHFFIRIEFYLSSDGELRILFDEVGGKSNERGNDNEELRYDKRLTDNREDISLLLQRIGWREGEFSVHKTLAKDISNFGEEDNGYDFV